MWKEILKKDSRITSHQRKGKKELDRRYGDNPDKRFGLEELNGEQVASASKQRRPLPYRGTRGESNRAMGDFDTAERMAIDETVEFLKDDSNFRTYVMPIISEDEGDAERQRFKLEHALRKDGSLKRSLEDKGVEYKFVNWADVSAAFVPY